MNPKFKASQTVYLRKGTNIIVPETMANKKDRNLVPMSVTDAIAHGYISQPQEQSGDNPELRAMQEETNRLREMLLKANDRAEEQDRMIKAMKNKLDLSEALSENEVSIGNASAGSFVTPPGEGAVTTPIDGGTNTLEKLEDIPESHVTPPPADAVVQNMAVDADDDGLSDLDSDPEEDTTAAAQAELDAFLNGGAPSA